MPRSKAPLILTIDQGSSSTRAIAFDLKGNIVHSTQHEFTQYYPNDGWVEQKPDEIWKTVVKACRQVRQDSVVFGSGILTALGITNQRETTVIWDSKTGEAIYNAIVWQDRRTAGYCRNASKKIKQLISDKTGLFLDPYFSATKIAWILDNVVGARQKAKRGQLLFGTIDCFLIWKLTKGTLHATDATNASRTLLYNIHTNEWDEDLLHLFKIPKAILPQVKDSCANYGIASNQHLGQNLPILSVIGDQQAAAIGQLCIHAGMTKSTYGTGCFMLMNTGNQAIASKHKLLTTIAYRLNGQTTYALEGSIFNAGTAIQWLQDELGFINGPEQTETIAASMKSNHGVYMVPAFTGLGAPYWDPDARGGIFGLTRDTNKNHIIRAALESVCYQTYDLLDAMNKDCGIQAKTVKVDGGMVVNNWLMQFLADILDVQIKRAHIHETTALGATMLAAIGKGYYDSLEHIDQAWQPGQSFHPKLDPLERNELIHAWHKAINKITNSNSNSTKTTTTTTTT